MLTTPGIKNTIRVWARRPIHAIVVDESEMDELAERIETSIQEIAREARKDGIREYAWMKDGATYVGTTGKTLKAALDDVDRGE